jgi:molybdopterin-guanine dinucleotide biosynthesis protein A
VTLMNFDAVILAAGRSSRMGRDKAWISVDGEPLLARQIGLARQLGPGQIFISGRADADYREFGCRVLIDEVPDAGPLAGIERALQESSAPLLLALAVDMPGMELPFLRRLAAVCTGTAGAIPRVNGQIEPLAAFYPKGAHSMAQTLLRERRLAAVHFAESCAQAGLAIMFDVPPVDHVFFTNWNLPQDAATK